MKRKGKEVKSITAMLLALTACGGAPFSALSEDPPISAVLPPTCALVPYNGTLRSDRFLQDGGEGSFWCSANSEAVQGNTPLDPSAGDGGVICTCPVGTACAPLVMENGDLAVSCWVSASPDGGVPEASPETSLPEASPEASSEAGSPEASAPLCCTVTDQTAECTGVMGMSYSCTGGSTQCYATGACWYASPGTGTCDGVVGVCQ